MSIKQLTRILKNLSRNGKIIFQSGVSSWKFSRSDIDEKTHTGQVFDKDDYRRVRFLNTKRYVNLNFPITLKNEYFPEECTERVISCGGELWSHPKIYINLDKPGAHYCFYCGRGYIKKAATQ